MNDAKRVQIMMPKILIEKIDKIAEDNDESRSSVVRRAVREYIYNHKVNNE